MLGYVCMVVKIDMNKVRVYHRIIQILCSPIIPWIEAKDVLLAYPPNQCRDCE